MNKRCVSNQNPIHFEARKSTHLGLLSNQPIPSRERVRKEIEKKPVHTHAHTAGPIGCHLLLLAVDKSRYLPRHHLTSPGKKSRYWEILCLTRIVRLPLRPVTAQTRGKPVTNYLSRPPRASTEVGELRFLPDRTPQRLPACLLGLCCLSPSLPPSLALSSVGSLQGSFGQDAGMC